MSKSKIREFDVVRLKDGREATVVEVYDRPELPLAYEVELHGTAMELRTVIPDEIDKVIWKSD